MTKFRKLKRNHLIMTILTAFAASISLFQGNWRAALAWAAVFLTFLLSKNREELIQSQQGLILSLKGV